MTPASSRERGKAETNPRSAWVTPGLHNKIPAHKIFARVWVAQEPILFIVVAKIFQGLGPKRRKSCDGDRVYHFKHTNVESALFECRSSIQKENTPPRQIIYNIYY